MKDPAVDSRILYADILDCPHPVSRSHRPMSRLNRAAQFSPFAALTGYDDLIRESARYTADREDADEDRKNDLDHKLFLLLAAAGTRPEVTVTWFKPDEKKEGGEVRTFSGRFLGYKDHDRLLLFEGGPALSPEDILAMESPLFDRAFLGSIF
ncbi:MAG: hypothetical protein J5865_01195 [Lachnospiraceae bacterium]|nr:hypothetical protein [Lachnospiraceae bacterium]